MKPLLLIMTSMPPKGQWPEWNTVWCAPSLLQRAESDADQVIILPGTKIPPLCQGLLVGEGWPLAVPVALITEQKASLPLPDADCARADLSAPDVGMLYFPRREQFVTCAQNAIRTHNPLQGPVTLQDCWHQASIMGMLSPEDECGLTRDVLDVEAGYV